MKSDAIDAIDRTILGQLVRNGRATYTELGREAGLSPHAVADRIRRLMDVGIVTGFGAAVDFGAIGRGLDALIDVRLLSTASPEDFEERTGDITSVREIAFVTGRFDYQLRVACRDADDLDRTVRALRQAGAAVTETRIVMRARVCHPAIP